MQTQEEIRNYIKLKRNQMNISDVQNFSQRVLKNLTSLNFLLQKKSFLVYKSFKNEVCTTALIDLLKKQNKQVYYPVIENENLVIAKPLGNNFTLDKFGIEIPINYEKLDNVDVIFVPLIACDKNKNRIGFGKGYYDRLLKNLNSIKVGLAYNFQILDNVPKNSWDVPLDYIVTESNIIK